jgi:hypothetical protein
MNDPLAGSDYPRVSWLFWFPSFFALPSFAKATADGASYAGRRAAGWCGEFVGSVDQNSHDFGYDRNDVNGSGSRDTLEQCLGFWYIRQCGPKSHDFGYDRNDVNGSGSRETLEQCLGFWYIG